MPNKPIRAALFDFHNTLVSGDGWLQLEIHTLPREVLIMLSRDGVLPAATITTALLDRADDLYRALREEAKSSGREVDAVSGANRVIDQLGLSGIDPAAIELAVEEAEAACLDETRAIEGAHETLAALTANGLRLGVVSSAAYTQFVLWGLERHDLARYFTVVATSAATGYYKSDPRLYHWALDQLGVSGDEAIHIGDHLRFDVLGAQRAGLRAVWYNPANAPITEATPDATIQSLRELPDLLRRSYLE